jgi:hypothetical protein
LKKFLNDLIHIAETNQEDGEEV